MSAPLELRERVLAVVRERGPVSGNAVARALRRRREDVSAALGVLEAAGQVRGTRSGWETAGNGPETAERAEPTCRDPEHRGLDWAMPGATVWICGVCHPPSKTLREYPLVFREGGAEPPPVEPATFAGAFDAWQREADR